MIDFLANFISWSHENYFFNPIISKTMHHKINMKMYSDRAKLARYINVFIVFEIIIFFPNKSHKR